MMEKKMADAKQVPSGRISLPYNLIRSLTSPSEKANGVQTWFANVSAREIIKIGTQDNLRTYIAEHQSGKRNFVHKQIALTIEELPDRFINRNSGVTITCTACTVDDNEKVATLTGASIINGAQTQGEIKRYFAALDDDDTSDFLVRAEIIMDPAHEQIVEVAIARNTATTVKSVSQAGARGHLTELKTSIESALPGETIQTSETDTEGLNTQSLLQWTRLLMPEGLLGVSTAGRNFAYKQGGKCLSDFSTWWAARITDERSREFYEFTVQMAPTAVKTYRHYESHDAWNGNHLHEKGKGGGVPEGGRPVRRDKKSNKIVWVAPGILFPILSALSAFVIHDGVKWKLEVPSLFSEEELIRRAIQQYSALDRQVALMGRGEVAYDALSIYTDTIASVLRSQS
jgi:hypothetical protein